jgi:hypothetical protein
MPFDTFLGRLEAHVLFLENDPDATKHELEQAKKAVDEYKKAFPNG